VSGQEQDSRKPSDHVKLAEVEVAVAIAKSMLLGVRVPEEAYRADASLAMWRMELERRGR
jgi:hypothetical protein